jgi:hypothetical protein
MIVSLLCSCEIIDSSQKYQVQKGMKILSGDSSLIISSIRKSQILCLAQCNLNDQCLTSVYLVSEKYENCFHYNKQFDASETTTSINSKIFIKTSKI